MTNAGFASSFQVVDRNATVTASVTAPASVTEGVDSAIALSLTLENVSTASGTVTLEFLPGSSSVTNGVDVSVPVYSGSFNVAQSPAGRYTINLPSIAIFDDLVAEGTETLSLRVRASGQVFAGGTDTTTITIALLDGDRAGTTGDDQVIGTGGRDVLNGMAGTDILMGMAGNDVLDGGSGADRMVGGTGDDIFYVDDVHDVVVEGAGEGNDRIFAGVSYALASGQSVETLSTSDQSATVAIDLSGNELDDLLIGNQGMNVLNGNAVATC